MPTYEGAPGSGYATLQGMHGSQVRGGGRQPANCLLSHDSAMLPCRVCMWRKSEGTGIPMYEGARDSGRLPVVYEWVAVQRGGGHAYI